MELVDYKQTRLLSRILWLEFDTSFCHLARTIKTADIAHIVVVF
jgi:hypothetical protein